MGAFAARLRKRWVDVTGLVVGAAVIAVVFFLVLPGIADYGDVWAAARDVSWPWIVLMLAAAAINVLTFGPPLVAALPGISYRSALANSLASTASTYIAPGGAALGMGVSAAMLRAWRFPARSITLAVTLTGLWNQFFTFGAPVIAFALLTYAGGHHAALQTLALIGLLVFLGGVGLFALVLSSPIQARWVGDVSARAWSAVLRRFRRGPAAWSGASWVRFRSSTLGLLRKRWHWLTLATIAGHMTVYITFIVTIRALGISNGEVTYIESFAAWTIARVIGSLPVTPGGFGLVEVGVTGALVAFGAPNSEAVAAVLVYRFLTVGPPLILGVIAGAMWRRLNPNWRDETVLIAPVDDSASA